MRAGCAQSRHSSAAQRLVLCSVCACMCVAIHCVRVCVLCVCARVWARECVRLVFIVRALGCARECVHASHACVPARVSMG